MDNPAAQQSQQPSQDTSNKPLMDKIFGDMSGCLQWFLIIVVPFITLLFSLVGLLACKDPKARSRAGNMALISVIWFIVAMLLFIGMISSATR